jgi:myo-inositol-1(or 4)-monophosphatase
LQQIQKSNFLSATCGLIERLKQLYILFMLSSIIEPVRQIAIQAGLFIEQEAQTFTPDKIELKGLNSLVSYVDKEAEKILVAGLSKILPEADFITEEGTVGDYEKGKKSYTTGSYWIIDPLDGTTNFSHGLPIYSVSVGLLQEGELTLGVVYDVCQKDCYAAFKNGGAFKNNQPIQVSQNKLLANSLQATGFPYYTFDVMEKYLKVVDTLMRNTRGLRRMGSAAIDLAYTACGKFDGFFEYGLQPWDVAGGIVIVREAGGSVTDFTGGNNYLFGGELVAGGYTQSDLLKVVKENWYNNE